MSNWIHYNNNPRTLTALGKLIELIEKDKIKIMNKKKMFYVGSSTVCNSSWLKSSLEDAIASASEICEERNAVQYVVKVVAIVKPKKKVSNVMVEIIK